VSDPGTSERSEPETRRRLHPLTPLLKGAKMLTVAVAAISWQGYAQLGFARWLVVTAVILVATVGLSAVSWLTTGFHVVNRELRIYEGLVWRRTRTIPLERVQAIDVVRPLLARLVGVAELRLEVIGASKTEAPLAYLTVAEASRLRERLLVLAARRTGPAANPAAGPAADPATGLAAGEGSDAGGAGDAGAAQAPTPPVETPIHAVNNRDVLLANVLTPAMLFVPVALALTMLQISYNPPAWTAIGVATIATALFGVILPPLRRVFADWGFRIAVDPAGLRLRHGLLDKRTQTVPPRRVQAVGITAPLLWRPLGWLRTRLDVAGYGPNAIEQGVRGGALLPVADRPTTRTVIGQVLGDVDIEALPLRPIPRKARWLSPLAWRKRAFGYTDEVVAARDGWLTERLAVARLARVQSVRVIQGPLQRRLGLADLHVDTAGGLHTVGRDRDAAEAYTLAGELAERSRAARAAERARETERHHRSPSPVTTKVSPT